MSQTGDPPIPIINPQREKSNLWDLWGFFFSVLFDIITEWKLLIGYSTIMASPFLECKTTVRRYCKNHKQEKKSLGWSHKTANASSHKCCSRSLVQQFSCLCRSLCKQTIVLDFFKKMYTTLVQDAKQIYQQEVPSTYRETPSAPNHCWMFAEKWQRHLSGMA